MAATARKQDENGYLVVKGCPITSYGIFDYGAGQLGLPGDPNRIVKVFRPPEAVSDPAAIQSFKDIPLINDHEMLSGFQGDDSATAPEQYGVGGVLTNNVYFDAPWMRGDLKFFSRGMQQALTSGKKDLSLGYSCDFHLTPGTFQGQPYEVVQTNMRGNHIALVDEGRVPGARVLDSRVFDHKTEFDVSSDSTTDVYSVEFHEIFSAVKPAASDGEPQMALKKGKAFDNAVEQLKALLPALEQFLNEEGKEPEHQDAGATGGMGGEAGSEAAPVTPDASATGEGGEATGGAEGGAATPEHTEAAASGAAEGAAQAAGGTEGGEAGGEAGGGENADIQALIAQAKQVLAKVEAALNGGQVGEDMNNGEGAIDSTQGLEGLREVNKGEGGAVCADEGGAEGAGATEGNGRAPKGPAAGIHAEAGDSALQRFYADLDVKTRLYDRVSKIVGAFDHRAMDARTVAAYGIRKLKVKCADGAEIATLQAYLDGRDGAKAQNQQIVQKRAEDTAAVVSEMDAYLNGAK